MDIIVGITGASGVIYGIRLLQALASSGVNTHLILSRWGAETIHLETDYQSVDVQALATHSYDWDDLSAPPASGSKKMEGMVIAPCSMKTTAAISCGYSDNLLTRAADVTIKEGRRLILLPRETPLSSIHLSNLLRLSQLGVVIMPPLPAFYHHPRSIDDIIDHTTARILDQLKIQHRLGGEWGKEV